MRTAFNRTNTTVFLDGTLTKYNFSGLLENVQDLIKMRRGEIIIDCTHLKLIDSLGLGTLIGLAENASRHGIKLYLIGLQHATVAADATNELKEHVIDKLDISNKVKQAANSGSDTPATSTPIRKRI